MLSPEGKHLVVFDHSLAQDPQGMIAAAFVDGHNRLALGPFAADVITAPAEQCCEVLPKDRFCEALFQASRGHWIAFEHADVFAILQTTGEFNFAELNGLESAGRPQPISKLDEIGGHHRLEDAELWNKKANNGRQAADQSFTLDDIILIEHLKDFIDLVEHKFEPQFENLMDDDEERFIMSGRLRQGLLQFQQFVQL